MDRRDRTHKYGFPLFIVVAIAAGAVMLVSLNQRTPPDAGAAQPYAVSATPTATVPKTSSPTASSPTTAPPSTAAPVRLTVLGAGVTNGNSSDFVGKKLGDTSWVSYATGPGVDFVGGWADAGAPSQRIATAAKAMPADVLVIDVGLEDQLRGTPFSQTSTNIDKMVQTVRAPKVILLSAPPLESQPNAAGTVNKQLEQLASDRGWTFVDAAAGVRSGTKYADGMSNDGKAPNAAGAKIIGAAVKAALLPR